MTSRRTVLLAALGMVAGARTLSACSPGPDESVAPPVSAPGTSTPATSTTAPSTTPKPTLGSSAAGAWHNADFRVLDTFLADTNGEAFAIWEDGAMVHEWYRTDADFTRDIASAQKSILSLLVGRAIGDGLIDMETLIDAILGSQWTPGGASAGITVSHLLAMTSGLDDSFAVVAAPGRQWLYSGAFSALFDVLAVVTGRELGDIADEWLFTPAGATSSVFYERPLGRFAPIGLRSTARDLVGVGRLVLEGGLSGLDDGWLTRSFEPSNSFNRSYGLLWWLPDQDSFMLPGARAEVRQGPMVPSAPVGTVAAWGKDDQKLYISPDQRLVVARLGGRAVPTSQAAWSSFDRELWDRLVVLRN